MKKKYIIVISLIGVLSLLLIFKNDKDEVLVKDDINIRNTIAMYKSEDKINYTEIEEMPSEGYIVNEEKTYCTTDNINQVKGKVKTIDGNIVITNINKNDKCYVWFDRLDDEKPIISDVATSVTTTEINVTVTATDNEGVTEYWYQLDSNPAVKGTGNTYKFTGLTAGTTYSVKVYVKDAAGNQSDTKTETVKTTPNGQTSETILAGITVKPGNPTFTNAATTDEGVYSMSDPMYGGTSYYWRGASTTNHVIFANKCWRIVRINGDKSIRLIYNGAVSSGKCTGNGSNSGSIAVTSQAYYPQYNRSEYVGYTFTEGSQRGTTTSSNLKSQTDTWYNNNIGNNTTYSSRVADGKFCNDRNTASGYSWSSQPSSTFYYAGYDRSGAKSASSVTPTLACNNASDVYTLKAGAITMDEVVMAGAKWGTANSSYYLYNGQYYWTMSPYCTNYADVFLVHYNGNLTDTSVDWTRGVRPVINLKADTLFAIGGDGTQNNPYVVS